MDKRSFSLVFGYLPEIDGRYPPAEKYVLEKRMAIVLSSYRPSVGEMYYDWEMLFNILIAVLPLFSYDRLTVQYKGRRKDFMSILEIKANRIVKLGNEDDYFDQLELSNNNVPVCLVNPEPYYAIGGPPLCPGC